MDDQDFTTLKDAPTGTLSDEFREQVWRKVESDVRHAGATHRHPRRWWLVSAAAVSVAVLIGVTIILTRPDDDAHLITSATSTPPPPPSSSAPVTTTPITTPATTTPPTDAATSTVPIPSPPATVPGSRVDKIRMFSDTSGWVVTSDALAHTGDAGRTWRTQPLPSTDRGAGAGSSFVLDADHAWVARSNTFKVTVFRTTDGGATAATTVVPSPFQAADAAGLVFTDEMSGWLSIRDLLSQSSTDTGRASLYRTTDGGVTFTLVDAGAPVPLAFIDAQTGWAAADGLYLTTNGATTWTKVYPPGWDIMGPVPAGPSYEIIFTTPELTVIKLYAPTGTQAQVRYVATDDLGATWRDVAPPDTAEVSNTGPQSMLDALTPSNWFGIRETGGDDAVLLTTTDGGATYTSSTLAFPALEIAMATSEVGWVVTATDLRLTADGGATWATVASFVTVDQQPETSTPSPPLTVSYLTPPPLFQPTPFATVTLTAAQQADVAVNDEHVIVLDSGSATATVLGRDGTVVTIVPLAVTPFATVAGPRDVLYGFEQNQTISDFRIVAIPLTGAKRGQVVAAENVDINRYTELPFASLGLGPTGVIDRVRDVGARLIGYVDEDGAPLAWDGPAIVTIDQASVVRSTGGAEWALSIERDPGYSEPYEGPTPPAATANGGATFWTKIGPSVGDGDFPPATVPVVAVLNADGSGHWYRLPDDWYVAASDVGGTVLARSQGERLDLAWLTP